MLPNLLVFAGLVLDGERETVRVVGCVDVLWVQ